MFRALMKLAPLLLIVSSGCSLLYDGDVFSGESDAAVPIPDADPAALILESVEPLAVFEGLGASETARAIPIVLHGSNIVAGARIEIVGAGLDLDVDALVSSDGTMAATTIRVPVDTELDAGMSKVATITLRQGADITATTTLTVQGLNELTATRLSELTAENGTLNTADIDPRYSRITISEAVTLTGDAPGRLVATDSIVVSNAILAAGRTDGLGNAGGYPGGLPAQNGGGSSGGTTGSSNGGAGGGGNLEEGGDGQGNGPGDGGVATDVPHLFPLADAVGHGGGGGGPGTAGAGGAGGAGGGAIELRADGPITLAEGTELSAAGAKGVSSGSCNLLGGGNGGGGAGGAILLRSATEFIVDAAVSISVQGGLGGSSGACIGGAGSPGRVRADAPDMVGSIGTAVRGPSWILASVPEIVDTAQLPASITGDLGATYFLTVNNMPTGMVTLAAPSENTILTLTPGLNQVCALVAIDGNQGQPESLNCISIAYLP